MLDLDPQDLYDNMQQLLIGFVSGAVVTALISFGLINKLINVFREEAFMYKMIFSNIIPAPTKENEKST